MNKIKYIKNLNINIIQNYLITNITL
jgi:hypothetical protein